MGLLRKASIKLLKRLSSRKRQCKAEREGVDTATPQQADSATRTDQELTQSSSVEMASTAAVLTRVTATVALQEQAESVDDACGGWSSEPAVNATGLSNLEGGLRRAVAAADLKMLPSTAATGNGGALGVRNLSSESDSGVCLGAESELHELEDEDYECDDEDFEWSDDEYECECEECAFARCEDILEDWHISAKDLALDKALSSNQEETVYR